MKNSETDKNTTQYGLERLVVAVAVCCIFGLALLVGIKALGLTLLLALILSAGSTIIGVLWLTKQLPVELIGIRKRKPLLSYAWLVIALVSVLQTARLSVFMIDSSQAQHSMFPGNKWLTEHCCLTAYNESAKFAGEGEENIYKPELYRGAEFLVNKEFRRKMDGFNVDPYHYPPPFLLLPTMTRAVVGGNFLDLRMLWFAISVLSLMTAIGFMIYHLEIEGRMRMIGMAPLIWCSMPVLAGLQLLNVQIIIIAVSIIAMLFFSLNRPLGGLLLAMSSVAKIFPGILFVYLVVQKKFREALWVAGFVLFLSVITLIVIGSNPFLAFLNFELPKLSSGEAFSGPFSKAFAVARNMAPFGLPLKLGWLGVPGMTLEIGRIVSSIYLLMVLILAVWAGRQKPRSNTEMISVWISLISLGSLVSPFAPATYVMISVVLLVCLNREIFKPLSVIIIWILISAPFLISQEAPFLIQALSYLPSQVIGIGVPAFILYRAGIRTTKEQDKIIEASVATEA